MKNDIDHFRKYSIVDYSVNIKKFREYVKYYFKSFLDRLYEKK